MVDGVLPTLLSVVEHGQTLGDLYIAPRLSFGDVFASRRRVPEDPPPSLSSISIIRAWVI